MDARKKTESTADREIIQERMFDAPRELVYRAWTDPAQIDNWWGPRGFRNATSEMDVRVGGRWRFMMHMANGVEYSNRVQYTEVVKNQRLVYEHGTDKDDDPDRFLVTVTFDDVGGKTKVTMKSVFSTAAQVEAVKKFGAVELGAETLDRLNEQLHTMNDASFSISRTFDAPRALVWKAYSESDRLAQWWGPAGLTMETCKCDFRRGGIFHYGMKSPDGKIMWGRFEYRDIVPEERIVFSSAFSDEHGGIGPCPFPMDWPREVLNVVTMVESKGATTVTLRGMPWNATPDQVKTFKSMHQSMNGGFKGTFDQLADYLAKAKGRT